MMKREFSLAVVYPRARLPPKQISPSVASSPSSLRSSTHAPISGSPAGTYPRDLEAAPLTCGCVPVVQTHVPLRPLALLNSEVALTMAKVLQM